MKAAGIVFRTPTPAQFPLYDAERKKTVANILAQGLVTQEIIDRLAEFQAYAPMPCREIGHVAIEKILQIHGIGVSVEGNDALCSLVGVPEWPDAELEEFEAAIRKRYIMRPDKGTYNILGVLDKILQRAMAEGNASSGQQTLDNPVPFKALPDGRKFMVFRYGQPVTFVKGVHAPYYEKTVLDTDLVVPV